MAKKYTYSTRVTENLRHEISREIVQSVESSPEMKQEILRVFQQSNRRIQNIQNAGLTSPAVLGLGEISDKKGFAKFSVRGKSWTEIKKSYGMAISFLNQPTSTAGGTREYQRQLMNNYNMTKTEFTALMDDYAGKISSLTGTAFVEKYLKGYKDFTGEMESAVASAAAQMESEAFSLSENLQNAIEGAADELAGDIFSMLEDFTAPF